MESKRTKSAKLKKYPSRYSPGKGVTAAQYIAELVCEKRAISLHRDLPIKFWNLPEWKGYYLYQIKLANKLLIEYNADSVIKGLNEIRNAYSLANPIVKKKIKKLSQILTPEVKNLEDGRTTKIVVQNLRKEQVAKNTMNTLLEMESNDRRN